jgi:cholinesterase
MRFRSFVAALCLVVSQQSAHAAFSNLVVLGDSLSDPGNFFGALATATGGSFAFPLPPYAGGRFSNGPVWAEYYAAANPGVNVSNIAMAGAFTGSYSTSLFGTVDNTADLSFAGTVLAPLAAVTTGLGTQLDSLSDVSGTNTAFALWAGANDINYAPLLGFGDLVSVVPTSLNNIGAAIDRLLALGASEVYVANLPDLGRTPDALASGFAPAFTIATDLFNSGLNDLAAAHGPQVRVVDIHAAFDLLLADAAALGLTDTTTACVDTFFGDATPCANPSEHVFWDGVHPTTGVHAAVATVFTETFAAPVPLPASGLLVVPGLALLALRRRQAA